MYICEECGARFEEPHTVETGYAFSYPPFEKYYVCPRCKTTNYCEEENE